MIRSENGNNLKKKLLTGINKLNDAVSSTLGPGGRNVLIQEQDGTFKITKDGVSVANAFTKLEDPLEDIGAQLIRKVSQKAVDKAGDGTTTATLLAATIINEGFKLITQGVNPIEVKRGIDKAVRAVVAELKDISEEMTEAQIKQVATISGNNDDEVGNLIAEAIAHVGEDGIVAIQESKTGETYLEKVEGMMLDKGYKSPYLVTDQNLAQSVLEIPVVLLYDGKITTSKQLLPALTAAQTQSAPILIIAEDISDEALAMLIVNKVRQGLKVCAVKAPDFSDRKTAILEDLAVLTGGTVLSAQKGHNLEKIAASQYADMFGKCRVATITAKDTTIVDGKGSAEAISQRLEEIKSQLEIAKSAFEKEKLQERLSKLTGGVAIINVGGLSEVEMKEKKDRVDDALHATKAALDQGVVPGAGMALVLCERALDNTGFIFELDNNDQKLGAEIVRKALFSPFQTILSNAGIDNHYKILSAVKENQIFEDSSWSGYNVKTRQYTNLRTEGVLDPAKVTRTALENAASVASTFLTTEAVVYELPGEKGTEAPDYSQYM